MTSQPRHKGQIKVEDVLKPFHSRRRLICEDFDQVWSSFIASRFEGIFVKLLDAVTNAEVDLRPCKSTVDAGCSFGRVTAKEVCARVRYIANESESKMSYCSCREQGRYRRSDR